MAPIAYDGRMENKPDDPLIRKNISLRASVWADVHDYHHRRKLKTETAAVADLVHAGLAQSDAGLVIVPAVATKAMTDAAHAALYRWREANGDPQQDPTNPEKHAIRWAAMVAAAQEIPE